MGNSIIYGVIKDYTRSISRLWHIATAFTFYGSYNPFASPIELSTTSGALINFGAPVDSDDTEREQKPNSKRNNGKA